MVDRRGSGRFLLNGLAAVAVTFAICACNGKAVSEYDQYDATDEAGSQTVQSQEPAEELSTLSASTLKIMPLGDSITQGDGNHRSYRYFLWKKLLSAGVDSDFVGSQQNNFNGDPEWPDYLGQAFDRDHEGHWGWRTDEVLEKLSEWLALNQPDVVLMHLGSNDMFHENSLQSTVEELRSVVEGLRAANPSVMIFLAQILPADRKNDQISQLNEAIAGLSQELQQTQSPLFLVDQNSNFSVAEDTYDGIHPDASGEEKMASRWLAALRAAGLFQ